MHLAVLLATDGETAAAEAASLCGAAVAAGHRASLFLLADATRLVEMGARVAASGARVSLCEADAAMRGVHKTGQPGVFFGSLYDWATLVEDSDRVITLA
jgi:sulfur relay (sulfurtransferase) complex TusBCD TusD component (DsrE family)